MIYDSLIFSIIQTSYHKEPQFFQVNIYIGS